MALLSFEFDFFIKSCRHFIGILAWTWAIFVFCLSYIGRSNSYNNNEHYYLNNNNYHRNGAHGAPSLYRTVFLPILKVLLVAPSASLAGPVPNPAPSPTVASEVSPQPSQPNANPVAIPWGQGVIVDGRAAQHIPQQGPIGGFIYCAGCSPINPGQLVIPGNIPLAQAFSASGVLPPPIAKAVQDGLEPSELQNLNAGKDEPGSGQKIWDDSAVPVQQMALHDDGRYR